MYLPHDLDSPLEVQTLLHDPPEDLLGLVFRLVQQKGFLNVVSVLHTRQLRDARGTHLVEEEGGINEGREGDGLNEGEEGWHQ